MKLILLFIFLLATIIDAKESKLELGIGAAQIAYPDYMGSKSYRTIAFVFPYLKYSSDYLSIDKEGINKKLFDIKNLTLDLSVSASLPANSKNNQVRAGMPDLNFTFGVGPKLSYLFYSSEVTKIYFDFSIRNMFETDLNMLNTQGIVNTSELKLKMEFDNIEIAFHSGVRFGDEKYHNYFYSVDKKYETSTRREYSAKSGYSSYRNKLNFTYRDASWWYGAYASYHLLRGAVYEDSPLVETDHAFFVGASLAYIFYVD